MNKSIDAVDDLGKKNFPGAVLSAWMEKVSLVNLALV